MQDLKILVTQKTADKWNTTVLEKKNLEGNRGNRETVSLGNRETALLKIRGKQGNRETAILRI